MDSVFHVVIKIDNWWIRYDYCIPDWVIFVMKFELEGHCYINIDELLAINESDWYLNPSLNEVYRPNENKAYHNQSNADHWYSENIVRYQIRNIQEILSE